MDLQMFGLTLIAFINFKDSFISTFEQRVLDCFKQTWHENMEKSLYTYQYFKTDFGIEKYLTFYLNS